MLGVSGGCEPEFALKFYRRTENLGESYAVYCKSVREYCELNNIEMTDDLELPSYFITSSEINWFNRVKVQAIMQDYVDTAISSTINLEERIPIKEVEQIYLSSWAHGLKGITLFRNNCKRLAILSTDNKKKEDTEEKKEDESKNDFKANRVDNVDCYDDLPWGTIINVNNDLVGIKRKIINGCGAFHLQAFYDELDGKIWETFISLGDGAGCERNLEFISRLISKCLRAGVSIDEIVESAQSVRPCLAFCNRKKSKGDTSEGTSCPSAIGCALKDFANKIKEEYCITELDDVSTVVEDTEDTEEDIISVNDSITHNIEVNSDNLCPDCGEPLSFEGGCNICHNCGYSKCS